MSQFEEFAPILPEEATAPVSSDCQNRFNLHAFTARINIAHQLPTSIYGAMLAIWHLRRVAQRRFPLHKGRTRDYLRYLAWCATWGRQKYRILLDLPEWEIELKKQILLPKLRNDRWEGTFSVSEFLYGISHYHYTVSAIMRDHRARNYVAQEYWRGGRHSSKLPQTPEWQSRRLEQNFGNLENFLRAISTSREYANFDKAKLIDQFGLHDVFKNAYSPTRTSVAAELPPDLNKRPYLPIPQKAIEAISLAHLGASFLKSLPNEHDLFDVTKTISTVERPVNSQRLPFGVNLFGHARGELGIGEDVRLVAQALEQNRVPFCIVDVQPGQGVSQNDKRVEHWITETPIFFFNLFCMTGIEHTRYACTHGLQNFRGRYNIGFWPWELPKWPKSCQHAYHLVDEIWGISEFTTRAYKDAPCPVRKMPLPVSVSHNSEAPRKSFGLPENTFLFVFTFDANSTYARKNPLGAIQAFQHAFPKRKNENVGMVVKAHHVHVRQSGWRKLVRMAMRDHRIHLINESMRYSRVLALVSSCDCYVSLHRSEGFGRGIAEALLMNLQVVATGYSGNIDFCDSSRVHLVSFHERKLRKDEYFFAEGQTWAEPDIEHASRLMRSAFVSPLPTADCLTDIQPGAAGAKYLARLNAIAEELKANEPDCNFDNL